MGRAPWAQTAADVSLRRIFMQSDGLLRTVREEHTVRLLQSIKILPSGPHS